MQSISSAGVEKSGEDRDEIPLSNSYDIFIRGQEICSGAQRCHDSVLLEKQMRARGIDPAPLGHYLESFRHGIPPHAGAALRSKNTRFFIFFINYFYLFVSLFIYLFIYFPLHQARGLDSIALLRCI